MPTEILTIAKRHRQMPAMIASLADFTLAPAGNADSGIILSNPSISLYCFDQASQRAIFAELPPHIDLSKVPFFYQTQYEQALRLLAVPYEDFLALAQDLPPVRGLTVIYMTGRSGSTLLHHALNTLDHVLSLSEPDAATQFVHLRHAFAGREAELRQMLDACMRFLFRPTPTKQASHFVVKLRNEGTQVMDLYQQTFPQASNLYLYREMNGWIESFYRIAKNRGDPEVMPLEMMLMLFDQIFHDDLQPREHYFAPGSTSVTLMEQLGIWWEAVIEWYLAKYAAGLPVLAVDYADLVGRPAQALAAIFAHCGLPVAAVADAIAVYAYDSQANSALARDIPKQGNDLRLTPEQRAEVAAVRARHPIFSRPFELPGKLKL